MGDPVRPLTYPTGTPAGLPRSYRPRRAARAHPLVVRPSTPPSTAAAPYDP